MDQKPTTTRRQFIATTTAAAAAFTIVPRHVLGGPRFVAPSDKVNVALIGAGGQGRTNARALFQEEDCQIIALADPAEEWDLSTWYYGGKSGRGPVKAEIEKHYSGKTPNHKCAVYEDFRVMLEKEKAIDAVLIATPDHLHAYVSILAMKSGKHVYCEKPLTHNIREARLVARVAKETGVATQMGNHGRSSEGHRQTVEWITDGAIGAVREVHAWSGKSAVRQEPRAGRGAVRPALRSQLGPLARPTGRTALQREVRPVRLAMGVGLRQRHHARHGAAPFRSGVQCARPRRAGHRGGRGLGRRSGDDHGQPLRHVPVRRAGKRGDRSRCTGTTTASGRRRRSASIRTTRSSGSARGTNGLMFVGEKGILTCAGWSGMPRLLPMALHREYKRPPKTLPRVAGHHADWLQACKGGTPACSNFDYGARLTEFILLGTLALRTGKVVKWDAAGMKATNAPEAQPFIEGRYRKGWELAI